MRKDTEKSRKMIEIHLYGRLRRYAPEPSSEQGTVLYIEPHDEETLRELLARLEIPQEALYHVFVNGSLFATHNSMAPWLVYPQAQENVSNWDMEIALKEGDRLGLFGEDMASLVV